MEVYHYAKFEDFVYTLYTEEKEGYHCAQLEDFTCRHVAVVFSSLARILGECLTIHSPPAVSCFFEVETSFRTLIQLYARISPQWLSHLR